MPLADHLRELRNRLVKSLLAIGAICGLSFIFYQRIIAFLERPLHKVVGCTITSGQQMPPGKHCAVLAISGLLGPFSILLNVGLLVGVVLATPIWLYQLWAFLAPGLHQHEKKYARWFVGAGVPLFLGGACLAYVILPTTAKVLIDLTPDKVTNILPLDNYLNLLERMIIVFGLSFELPLLLVMLNLAGVLSGRRMLGWWRWMIMGITVFAAIATPSTDPLTMLALAAPITALFFIAIGFSLINDRRKARRADDGLSPDEASELDLTPQDLPSVESVTTPALGDGSDEGDGGGYDDVT